MEELNKANEVEEAKAPRYHPMELSVEEALGLTTERAIELGEIALAINEDVAENTDIGTNIDEKNYGPLIHALSTRIEAHKDLTRTEKNYLLFDLGDQLGYKRGIFRQPPALSSIMSILSQGEA